MNRSPSSMRCFSTGAADARKDRLAPDNLPCGSISNFLYRSSSPMALACVRMERDPAPRPARPSLSVLGSLAAATLWSLTPLGANAQTATGTGAVSDGVGSSANGQGSVAIGNDNRAVGDGSLANGDSNSARITFAHHSSNA